MEFIVPKEAVLSGGMPSIVNLQEIDGLFDRSAIVGSVKAAIISHSLGDVISPMPGQLVFPEADGDCHIKFCRMKGHSSFVIKVATGFYRNPLRGLPVNGGCVLLFSAETGELQTIFLDEGWLTAWRTAAAGYVASVALADPGVSKIAIVGTGHQARLQAQWLSKAFPAAKMVAAGRSPERARQMASDLGKLGIAVQSSASIDEAVHSAGLIVTATAAQGPLFRADAVGAGAHVTALGSDTPGKQELDPVLLARAQVVAVDDYDQCADHGEAGWALRANLIEPGKCVLLGDILSGRSPGRNNDSAITVADLTGIAAQDIAIASLFLRMRNKGLSSDKVH